MTRGRLAVGLFAAAVGVAAIPVGGSAAATAGPVDTVTVPAGTGAGGSLSCSQLEDLWVKAGGSRSTAFLAAEVARAESGGRQYATDHDSNGTTDYGYWQINDSAHPGMATYDPLGNARSAVAISQNGTNWSPWVTYQHGAENGQC